VKKPTRKKRFRKFVYLLLLVGVAGGGYKVCTRPAPPVEVQTEALHRRNLRSIVTGTGQVKPKVSVDVSSDVMGRVLEVPVEEGQKVKKGDTLLRIDSSQLEARVSGLRAAVESGKATLEQARSNLGRLQKTYERQTNMYKQKLVSDADYEQTQTALDNAIAAEAQARAALNQAQSTLQEIENTLGKYLIVSPMAGVVTRKNIEPGEIAVAGTLSIAGTLLLTIADLSVIEVELEVDEVDIVHVALGQKAKVTVDAYPDKSWEGEVTEVGTSALEKLTTTEQAKDYRVVITLSEAAQELKPGLSASADIVTATRENVLSVPIQALTTRSEEELSEGKESEGTATPTGDGAAHAAADPKPAEAKPPAEEKSGSKEMEGVFVLEGGKAHFRPVKIGIPGEQHFEVLEGLKEGEVVVTGPYEVLRKLKDEEIVREKGKKETSKEPTPSGK
jgi:HlyD family secretion protein